MKTSFIEIPLFAGQETESFDFLRLKPATYRGFLKIAEKSGRTFNEVFVDMICDDLGLPRNDRRRKVPVISAALAKRRTLRNT
jgi:hypothetical protein